MQSAIAMAAEQYSRWKSGSTVDVDAGHTATQFFPVLSDEKDVQVTVVPAEQEGVIKEGGVMLHGHTDNDHVASPLAATDSSRMVGPVSTREESGVPASSEVAAGKVMQSHLGSPASHFISPFATPGFNKSLPRTPTSAYAPATARSSSSMARGVSMGRSIGKREKGAEEESERGGVSGEEGTVSSILKVCISYLQVGSAVQRCAVCQYSGVPCVIWWSWMASMSDMCLFVLLAWLAPDPVARIQ
jgi:hypothetical protein